MKLKRNQIDYASAFKIYCGDGIIKSCLNLIYFYLIFYLSTVLFSIIFSHTSSDSTEINKMSDTFLLLSIQLINIVMTGVTPIDKKQNIFAKFVRTLPNSFEVYKKSYLMKRVLSILCAFIMELVVYILNVLGIIPLEIGFKGLVIYLCAIIATSFGVEFTYLIKNQIINCIISVIWIIGLMVAGHALALTVESVFIIIIFIIVSIICFYIGVRTNYYTMKKEWTA